MRAAQSPQQVRCPSVPLMPAAEARPPRRWQTDPAGHAQPAAGPALRWAHSRLARIHVLGDGVNADRNSVEDRHTRERLDVAGPFARQNI